MDEIRYHVELFNGDLTKIVFEDGYNPHAHGLSFAQVRQELREFRATHLHDLSALDRARAQRFSRYNPQTLEETLKPAKKGNRKVDNDE